MREKIKALIVHYRHFILYGIFGCGTVAIDYGLYGLCYLVLGIPNVASNVIGTFCSIFFSFAMNRRWVFMSETKTVKGYLLEFGAFFALRMLSMLGSVIIMWWTVDVQQWNALLMKVFATVVSIIINYLTSRFIVFRPHVFHRERS